MLSRDEVLLSMNRSKARIGSSKSWAILTSLKYLCVLMTELEPDLSAEGFIK